MPAEKRPPECLSNFQKHYDPSENEHEPVDVLFPGEEPRWFREPPTTPGPPRLPEKILSSGRERNPDERRRPQAEASDEEDLVRNAHSLDQKLIWGA